MVTFIIVIIVGIICVVLGIKNTRGDISSLHSYHRDKVSANDVLPFGKLVGTGIIIVGTSVIAMGCFSIDAVVFEKEVFTIIGTGVLTVGLIVGCILSFYAIKKYNKRIF